MGPSTPESVPGPDSRNMGVATPSEKYTYVQTYRQSNYSNNCLLCLFVLCVLFCYLYFPLFLVSYAVFFLYFSIAFFLSFLLYCLLPFAFLMLFLFHFCLFLLLSSTCLSSLLFSNFHLFLTLFYFLNSTFYHSSHSVTPLLLLLLLSCCSFSFLIRASMNAAASQLKNFGDLSTTAVGNIKSFAGNLVNRRNAMNQNS